ncbi:MAG: dephospho-CoA kinase [Verrucomicrobiae bacterium]|nr:dephospho-CoA kinase [Verrucomicrobiae bacterium]
MAHLIGLTGGLGCGKSTAAKLLSEMGWHVIDTDEIAREIVIPGKPAWEKIKTLFGENYFHADGTLNRAKLAETIFHDAKRLSELNAILHPIIREEWKRQSEKLLAQDQDVLVVIPLLYETEAETEFEKVIAIGCSESVVRSRISARGWSEDQITARLRAQWPLDRKMQKADIAIWNDGDTELLKKQLSAVIKKFW